ncbi:MAG: metallophosphoesterase [Amylibacter sp.]|jgi:3',5'-cyclic-AMP phosphodiesterase|nr:metallophosphoesterase [Amylibacter sp.]
MTKLLALTDIHIKPVGQTIIGLDPYENFKRALKHAFDHHPDAERVILMGDLTNSGTPEEYARFGEVLKSCDKPITLMCGNHDQRDNLTAAFPWATLDANGFVQDAFVYGNTRVLTIDTQYGPPFVSYAHFGAYCDPRFDWLNTQLAAAKAEGQNVALFAHHPPFKVGLKGLDQIRMRDDKRMAQTLAFADVPVHLLCGHLHRTISGSWHGHGFTVFKSTCHQTPLAFDDPSMSLSTAEPAAYGVILLTNDGVIAHTEDFDLAEDDVQPSSEAMSDA